MEIKVWRRKLGRVDTLDLEEYIKDVLPNEIYPSWPEESLMANAILARSYALYHVENPKYPKMGAHVDDTTASQVYRPGNRRVSTDAAVDFTRGMVVVDVESRRVVQTFYSASCGGKTENTWNPRNLIVHTDCPCSKHGHKRHGHGHGGCQWGTKYLADAGKSVDEIIKFYFRNVAIVSNYGNTRVLVCPHCDNEVTIPD